MLTPKEIKMEEQVLRITSLALKINGFQARSRENYPDMPTIFLRYYGHVNMLEVEVCVEGWEAECNYDYTQKIYLEAGNKATLSTLAATILYLEEVLDDLQDIHSTK